MSTATVSTTRRRSRITRDAHIIRLFGILIALTAFFLIVKSNAFLSAGTWQSMGVQFPEYGLMALGVMLTMITGGIDLSTVGIANMTAISAAAIMLNMAPTGAGEGQQATAVAVGVVVSLVMGALAGLLNGFLVAKVRIPAILVTLGTLELFTGIAIIITGGKPLSGLPPVYGETFGGKVIGIPIPLIVFAVVAVAIWFILHRMAYGSKLYMLGSNATAAKFSGLNATSLLLRTYMISGLTSAIAGLVMLANYNSAKADYGVAYTLLTILIVVLGGVHPNGGSGKLIGVVLAIAILQILSSGLNMFPNISNFYRPLIWGAVLLVVISTQDLGRDFWNRFKKRKE